MSKHSDQRQTNLLLGFLAACAAGVVLLALRDILVPLLIALLLSYAIMPIVRLGKRWRVPVVVSLLVGLAGFCALLFLLGRLIYASAFDFAAQLPALEAELRPWLVRGLQLLGVPGDALPSAQEPIDWSRILGPLSGVAGGYLFSWLGSLVLIVFFLIFIVLDRGHGHLDRRIIAAFSPPGSERARPVVEEIHRQIERYILIKTGIAILNGALGALVLVLFGVPFAALFGAITFLLDYIPNIGSIVATILPVLVALVHFESPRSALWVALALSAVQIGIANLVEPLLFGKSLNLNTITVLLVLVFWSWLWGIAGAVLAVPLTVAFRIVAHHAPALRPVETLMRDGEPT